MKIERDQDNIVIKISIGDTALIVLSAAVIVLVATVGYLVGYNQAALGTSLGQPFFFAGVSLAATLFLLSIGLTSREWFRGR